MPIDLGLSRISRLLRQLGNPHKTYKSAHIAGTNGKGSTVAYLSSVLTSSKVRNGRFTSPHMVYYNDCVCINNETYPLPKFEQVRALVRKTNDELKLQCTEFELLTATAFKIFELEKVEIALIEVGLGGRLDATNVLEANTSSSPGVVVTAITKIAFDHEGFLGDTLEKIANEKAGILKENIPCVVDGTNEHSVLSVIQSKAASTSCNLIIAGGDQDAKELIKVSPLNGAYQLSNLCVALRAIDILKGYLPIDNHTIREGIKNTKWIGRLQTVEIPEKNLTVLVDGSHNENAAIELARYLEHSTNRTEGIIFIVGFTKGKSIDGLLKHTVTRRNDTVYPTSFSQPEGMPWIKSAAPDNIAKVAANYTDDLQPYGTLEDILNRISSKKENGDERPVVIFGSLYLVSDVLRAVEAKK
ncbi:putative dihydrofolate synthetase [Meyerozyma sp. JA9]|nr:putative dihydrofolate synthetase [Meyerozyma sp. JA9]